MVGAFWFLTIFKIGSIPTRATPWINARSRVGHRSPSPLSLAPGRCARC